MPCTRTILFVDDEKFVLDALRRALRGQHDCWNMHFAQSVDDALEKVQAVSFDTIVTDVTMPERDGLDLLATLQNSDATQDIPVVILTGLADVDLKRRALELGAVDLLNKPIVTEDLIARLHSVLRLKSYQDELRDHNELLECKVRKRTLELEQSRLEIIWRLAKSGEYRDEQTGNHVARVGSYCRAIAENLGMPCDFTEMISHTSLLHDLGKIGISDTILLKRGHLNSLEWKFMQQHCQIGYKILKHDPMGLAIFLRLPGDDHTTTPSTFNNPLLQQAAIIARSHHEKWDGSGYPRNLRGNEIPLPARIVAVADVYDALSHARPYKPAFPEQQVLSIMDEVAPQHFDPAIYAAFLKIKSEFQTIKHELADQSHQSDERAVMDSVA